MYRALVLLALVAAPSTIHGQGSIALPVTLAELEKRARVDSNDAIAHYNLALGYWNAKRWDDVDRELRSTLALDPRNASAHLALAYAGFAKQPRIIEQLARATRQPTGEVASVLENHQRSYRRAFLINPLVDIQIAATTQRSDGYADLRDVYGELFANYLSGLTQCTEGKYDACEISLAHVIADAQRGVKGDQYVPDAVYWYHGLAAAHQKHYDAAIADYTRLIQRDEAAVKKYEEKDLLHVPLRTNEYRYFLAVFNHAAGHTDAAISLYHEALEKDLGLYQAHVRLAEIYEARRDYPRATEERRRAVNANPDDPSLQMDLGVTLGKSGDFAEAEKALQAATGALPRSAEAWFWLGLAQEQLGKRGEARTAFEHVVALAPSRLANLVAQAKQHVAALQ